MKEFEVMYEITGRATAIVEAESEEEAREKANKLEVEEDSVELLEWEFGKVEELDEV